jgi:anti-anti-sigma factor
VTSARLSEPTSHGCFLDPPNSESDQPVVWLRRTIDVGANDALIDSLVQAMSLGTPMVVVDMSGVSCISATAVETIKRANDLLRRRGRELVLRAPSHHVRWVFRLCGLTNVIDVDPSVEPIDPAGRADALRSWIAVPVAAADRPPTEAVVESAIGPP